MLGNEIFLLPPTPKSGDLIGVTWFYPNSYSVGMFGLGYQLVWRLLESDPQTLVSRGFTDKQETAQIDNELLGFTFAWELDFINILEILDKNGVPGSVEERDERHPLVFGGGPVLSANPEPFSDIFDVILLGDAEVTIPTFLEAWKQVRKLKTRIEQLWQLAQVPGLYVPSLYEVSYETADGAISAITPISNKDSIESKQIERSNLQGSIPERLSKQLFTPSPEYVAHSVMLSPDTAWSDIFLIEVVRSCPQECRFCLASFLTRPFRAVKTDALMNAIELGLRHTKNIGLLGPSVTEHPQFEEIALRLQEKKDARISVASVRADTLTETILACLKKLGQKSVTIAIESGSERLRAIMKKNLSEAEICHAVDLIDKSGLESVKFYGIAGLPYETEEDIEETVRLLTMLKKRHKRLRFVFGISSFVPKAQTPFQWHGRNRNCAKTMEFIRKRLAKAGIDVRPESHNWSDIQAMLSRGDRRLTPVLKQVAQAGGKLGAWKKAFREAPPGCPNLEYYAFRDIPEGEILPWSHLVEPTKTEFLQKHQDQALAASQLASQLKSL